MPEVEIPYIRVTREGVKPEETAQDAGDGLFLAGNDGNSTLRITGTGTLTAVPADPPPGWPAYEADVVEVDGFAEAGPWPPAVYNRPDGSVLFQADAGLQVLATGI